MQNLITRLNVMILTLENWLAEQPHNIRWAVNCAVIGIVIMVIEAIFVLAGACNWPILLITAIFFGIGTVTISEWDGQGGD